MYIYYTAVMVRKRELTSLFSRIVGKQTLTTALHQKNWRCHFANQIFVCFKMFSRPLTPLFCKKSVLPPCGVHVI